MDAQSTNTAFFLQKCVHYWPEKEGTYGPFTIRVQGISECAEYVVRSLSIQVGPSPILGSAGVLKCPGSVGGEVCRALSAQ